MRELGHLDAAVPQSPQHGTQLGCDESDHGRTLLHRPCDRNIYVAIDEGLVEGDGCRVEVGEQLLRVSKSWPRVRQSLVNHEAEGRELAKCILPISIRGNL